VTRAVRRCIWNACNAQGLGWRVCHLKLVCPGAGQDRRVCFCSSLLLSQCLTLLCEQVSLLCVLVIAATSGQHIARPALSGNWDVAKGWRLINRAYMSPASLRYHLVGVHTDDRCRCTAVGNEAYRGCGGETPQPRRGSCDGMCGATAGGFTNNQRGMGVEQAVQRVGCGSSSDGNQDG